MSDNFPLHLSNQVKKAVLILRKGGIVAFPTDTVYGLGADIYNDDAVKKIFLAKRRPVNMPLPILIDSISQLSELVLEQPDFSKILVEKFWPGGLTIIFRKSPTFQSMALSGGDKVGIRLPDHELVRLIIRELGRPIAGTSANLHGREAILTANKVAEEFGRQVDYIIDGGLCPGGQESTIVDITVKPPAIVRQGIIPTKEIMTEYCEKGGI